MYKMLKHFGKLIMRKVLVKVLLLEVYGPVGHTMAVNVYHGG